MASGITRHEYTRKPRAAYSSYCAQI